MHTTHPKYDIIMTTVSLGNAFNSQMFLFSNFTSLVQVPKSAVRALFNLFTDRPIPVFGSSQSLYIKLLNCNLAQCLIKKSIAYQNLCTWPFRMFQFFTPPSFYYRTLVYIMIASKTNNVASRGSRYGHRKCVNSNN